MDSSENRKQSFIGKGWDNSIPVSVDELSDAGFYYTEVSGLDECFICSKIIYEWAEEDPLLVAHVKYSPNCEYLNFIKKLDITRDCLRESDFSDIPRHPDLITGRVRNQTIIDKGWEQSTPMSVNELLEAGFYRTGIMDEIECYYCSLRIRIRDKRDEILKAHELLSPNCYLFKSRKFIKFFNQCEIASQNDNNIERISGVIDF